MMASNEMVRVQDAVLAIPADMTEAVTQMTQAMRGMADMIRSTNERMTSLEQQVRLLTKVTPGQAGKINAAIRDRAKEICEGYHCSGSEKAAAAAIRKDVRLMQGVTSVRELPRCEYAVVLQQVQIWDDYKTMKTIRAKGAGK